MTENSQRKKAFGSRGEYIPWEIMIQIQATTNLLGQGTKCDKLQKLYTMGIIFSFLLQIFTIFRLLLGGFLALPKKLFYCFYCIIKNWSKLSQKTGSLPHFEGFFNYTLLHPDKLHTPIFCQIKHLVLWYGRYIHNFGKSLLQHLQLSSYKFSNLFVFELLFSVFRTKDQL